MVKAFASMLISLGIILGLSLFEMHYVGKTFKQFIDVLFILQDKAKDNVKQAGKLFCCTEAEYLEDMAAQAPLVEPPLAPLLLESVPAQASPPLLALVASPGLPEPLAQAPPASPEPLLPPSH